LVRCCSKPACMLLLTSSSMPYPDNAMPCGIHNSVNGGGRKQSCRQSDWRTRRL
jgi:hypothetical protein